MNSPDNLSWQPPSSHLIKLNSLWQAPSIGPVSYPKQGNDDCYQVENSSYWFRHRNQCIIEMLRRFPVSGTFYDIGGGNGFVAAGLQNEGIDVALVEPGNGAFKAVKRGIKKVIWSTLEDAHLHRGSIFSAGAFDVIEHIQDDLAFLGVIRALMVPGGRFFCSVPASRLLWSNVDIFAGHFRRYSRRSMTLLLQRAGFEVEFVSHMFAWLVMPVLLSRAISSKFRANTQSDSDSAATARRDHRLPKIMSGPVNLAHWWELWCLKNLRVIPLGTSLLAVARASPNSPGRDKDPLDETTPEKRPCKSVNTSA